MVNIDDWGRLGFTRSCRWHSGYRLDQLANAISAVCARKADVPVAEFERCDGQDCPARNAQQQELHGSLLSRAYRADKWLLGRSHSAVLEIGRASGRERGGKYGKNLCV